MPQPHVLVISHNVFSASGNMGKTMENLLGGVDPAHLAQLYFHSEVPTRRCCLRYFRITDRDVLRSRLSRQEALSARQEAQGCFYRPSLRCQRQRPPRPPYRD